MPSELALGIKMRSQSELTALHSEVRLLKEKHLRAGFIITTVGSLRHAAIRLADQSAATRQIFSVIIVICGAPISGAYYSRAWQAGLLRRHQRKDY